MRVRETYYSFSSDKIMDMLVLTFIPIIPYTYANKMLYVSIYDPLRAQSEDNIQYIGENGLIEVYSGRANWEK